ncbi:hypothetical protein TNCV_2040011 [Trichonephila clavipes]|nr:hypothetical protein TNCV_2040011 [Trichonephila clavipes]
MACPKYSVACHHWHACHWFAIPALYQGAKKVKQQEYQKQKWSTTSLPGEERRSENNNRSVSLEVLVGDVNYKS